VSGVEQLPSGRHGIPRERVRQHQRDRILDATASALADLGYERVTVSVIIARARLSRKTFYEQFADRDEAIVAATERSGLTQALVGVETLDLSGWRLVRSAA